MSDNTKEILMTKNESQGATNALAYAQTSASFDPDGEETFMEHVDRAKKASFDKIHPVVVKQVDWWLAKDSFLSPNPDKTKVSKIATKGDALRFIAAVSENEGNLPSNAHIAAVSDSNLKIILDLSKSMGLAYGYLDTDLQLDTTWKGATRDAKSVHQDDLGTIFEPLENLSGLDDLLTKDSTPLGEIATLDNPADIDALHSAAIDEDKIILGRRDV